MQLEYLNLENINISDITGVKMIISLSDCPNLLHLILNRNELSTKSAKEFAKQKDYFAGLHTLELN